MTTDDSIIFCSLHEQGEGGVEDVLELLNEELVQAMQLLGCASLADVKPCMVAHENRYYAKL